MGTIETVASLFGVRDGGGDVVGRRTTGDDEVFVGSLGESEVPITTFASKIRMLAAEKACGFKGEEKIAVGSSRSAPGLRKIFFAQE